MRVFFGAAASPGAGEGAAVAGAGAQPKLGALAARPANLKRAEGALISVLERYLDGTISVHGHEALPRP